jgi:UDP-N-acetylglucosamine 2-epimerase (non-hydrolysing)
MRFAVIIGTRPEAIKLLPLILLMKKNKVEVSVISTGQHREMLQQVFDWFEVQPDFDFSIMKERQSLNSISSSILEKLDVLLDELKPDCLIVQGDTSTAFSSALAAFYKKIKIAHIEAGLRTWNKNSPWPEEMNRVLISKLADFHFSPTEWSCQNLLKENIDRSTIFLTGNTVIDALFFTLQKLKSAPSVSDVINELFTNIKTDQKIILITGHRRENWGSGFENICESIKQLAYQNTDCIFIYPVHLNPNVKVIVHEKLSGIKNILLIDPLSYPEFISLIHRSYLIMTDSGGVQEEAPSLGKPVILMRDTTERPEGIEAGNVLMVGSSTSNITAAVTQLLRDKELYTHMSQLSNPYGDGKTSERILAILLEKLKKA